LDKNLKRDSFNGEPSAMDNGTFGDRSTVRLVWYLQDLPVLSGKEEICRLKKYTLNTKG
jgi:hypothetical protein